MTPEAPQHLPCFVTVIEVALLLQVHQRTVHRLIARGDLKAVWITSRLCRIDQAEVLAFVERRNNATLAAMGRSIRGRRNYR